jgi:hypothetical protein
LVTSGRSRPRWTWDGLALTLAVLIIGGPALFTADGFAYDFTNHLWLVWVQEQAISHHVAPTYFVNAPEVGVFYPYFMFYGGTLYAASGGLAALLGGRVAVAFVLVTLLAIAGAYGGVLWIARQLGARSWMAHAPAIAFAGSAYYVTNLYGRGAWPEFIATSAIPLLVASAWALLTRPRLEPLPATLFVTAAVVFTGSHNITLLLGTIGLTAAGVALRLALGPGVMQPGTRRLLQLAGLLALALAVNAWFLLPDLLHASQTQISAGRIYKWGATGFFNTPGILFDPLRRVPTQSTAPGLFVQAPDWFLLWVVAAAAAFWTRTEPRLRRAAGALAVLLAAFLALLLIGPLWNAMPRTLRAVQFPYRLNTLVALLSSGLVLVWVLALQRTDHRRRRRLLGGALIGSVGISAGLCLWQLWVPTTRPALAYADRRGVFVSTHMTPRTWYDHGAYADAGERRIEKPRRYLTIEPRRIAGDRVSLTVTPPPGSAPFSTDIAAGPYAARLGGGLVRAGRTPGGATVARRARPGAGPVRLTLAPADSTGAGGLISELAILLLILLALLAAVRRGAARRASRP